MNCADLARVIGAHPLAGWSCAVERDLLRLHSPMRYPDGGLIELFVEGGVAGFRVTDLGEAFRFLETSGIDPERSATRRQLIEMATRLGGAQLRDGEIMIEVDTPQGVFPAAQRLAQVITRVGDLVLFAKGTVGNSFSDAVEEFLRSVTVGIEFRRGELVRGRHAEHRVDLVARSFHGVSVIEGLSAVTLAGANAQTAYTIQKFADIAALGETAPSRFAVLDDSAEVWTESFRKQLEQFSTVVDWERRDILAEALGARRGR